MANKSSTEASSSPTNTDERIIHYIFKAVSQRPSPWKASALKSWLQAYKDPLLVSAITNMKGISGVVAYLTKFPEHFELYPQSSVKVKGSKCPYCGKSVHEHSKRKAEVYIPAASPSSKFTGATASSTSPLSSYPFTPFSPPAPSNLPINTSKIPTNSTNFTTSTSSSHSPAPHLPFDKPNTPSLTPAVSTFLANYTSCTPNTPHQVNTISTLATATILQATVINSSPTIPHPQPRLPPFVITSGKHSYGLVENVEQCLQAVAYINNSTTVAVDCEGVNLGKTGKLCFVQIAGLTSSNEPFIFIFDIVLLEKRPQFDLARDLLTSILQNPKFLKVMHDGRQDSSALYHQHNITVANIYDTQIAYRMLAELKRGTPSYSTDDCKRIGLNNLLQKYEFPVLKLKEEVHKRMETIGSSFWMMRPLTNDLIQYMIYDVASLIPLMEKLNMDVQCRSLQSIHELSYANSRYHVDAPSNSPAPNCLVELTFSSDYKCLYQATDPDPTTRSTKDNFLVDDDTVTLTSLLPANIRTRALQKSIEVKHHLIEVVMDHERPVSLRFGDISDIHLTEVANIHSALECLSAGIKSITKTSGQLNFMSDNRLGISKMLHRISAIKSRTGEIVGLTYRIGRSVEGVSHMIQDLLATVAGYGGKKPSSLLFLGRPGVGKTTVLREVSRLLAGKFNRRVIVVDTSNEIAGDGDIPHPCIGFARRVQVPNRNEQYSVLIEAVQNHSPHVIVVDEIGTSQEVEAVKSITQRGVSMVGTAHGEDLHTLLKNPTLRGLVGGVQQVILSSAEAMQQNKNNAQYKKTRLERAGAPTFDIIVELRERSKWRVYTNVADIIDQLLANANPIVETRMSVGDKKIHAIFSEERAHDDWFEQLQQVTSDK